MKFVFLLILSILALLTACSNESPEPIHFKQPNFNTINTTYWDYPSQQVFNSFMSIEFDGLSYANKRKMAEVLLTHNYSGEAITVLDSIDAVKSQYLVYLLLLANYTNGDFEKALDIFINEKSNKSNLPLVNLYYKILLELGRGKEVISHFVLNKHADFITNYYLALAYLQDNQCNKTIPLLTTVIDKNPNANKLYAPLATALQKCNRLQEANEARLKHGTIALPANDEFAQRLEKNGNPVKYTNELLRIATSQNDSTKIRGLSEQLIQYKYFSTELYVNYAIALRQARLLNQANLALFEAIKLNGSHEKSYQLLFEFNRASNKAIAKEAINNLIQLDPSNTLYKKAKNYLENSE